MESVLEKSRAERRHQEWLERQAARDELLTGLKTGLIDLMQKFLKAKRV